MVQALWAAAPGDEARQHMQDVWLEVGEKGKEAMLIISFSWTTPALVAGEKKVTRRDWNPEYAKRFRASMWCQAYDKSPRIGGRPVGVIELTDDPVLQWSNRAPLSDYKLEGFEFLVKVGATMNGLSPQAVWNSWMVHPHELYVVRFKLVELTVYGESIRRSFYGK